MSLLFSFRITFLSSSPWSSSSKSSVYLSIYWLYLVRIYNYQKNLPHNCYRKASWELFIICYVWTTNLWRLLFTFHKPAEVLLFGYHIDGLLFITVLIIGLFRYKFQILTGCKRWYCPNLYALPEVFFPCGCTIWFKLEPLHVVMNQDLAYQPPTDTSEIEINFGIHIGIHNLLY